MMFPVAQFSANFCRTSAQLWSPNNFPKHPKSSQNTEWRWWHLLEKDGHPVEKNRVDTFQHMNTMVRPTPENTRKHLKKRRIFELANDVFLLTCCVFRG